MYCVLVCLQNKILKKTVILAKLDFYRQWTKLFLANIKET